MDPVLGNAYPCYILPVPDGCFFVRNYIHYSMGCHQRSATSDKGNVDLNRTCLLLSQLLTLVCLTTCLCYLHLHHVYIVSFLVDQSTHEFYRSTGNHKEFLPDR